MSIVKLNNRGVRSATAFGSITALGSLIFIKKLTASSSSTISFVDGSSDVVLDNSYKEYLFTFNNIHPSVDQPAFQFNLSIDSGSNYNVTKTSTSFRAYQSEGGGSTAVQYEANHDLAQSTSAERLCAADLGNDNDQSASGELRLFDPSSTTYVKHWVSTMQIYNSSDYSVIFRTAGYFNTTSAIDEIQFKPASGTIDAGVIKLYGVS